MIEIKPHRWTDSLGHNCRADYFPFINDNPVPAIAHCEYCKHHRASQKWCNGWKDDQENAPLFCGPICHKFDLVAGTKKRLIEEIMGGS